MSDVHNHEAMVSTSTPLMHHDHPPQTGITSGGQGLGMMMMAVSINLNTE